MTFRCPNGQYYFERIPLSQNIEYRVQAFFENVNTRVSSVIVCSHHVVIMQSDCVLKQHGHDVRKHLAK